MATAHFSSMPNVSLPRTKMPVTFTHGTSFNHGKLIPVFCSFVQPGDSFHLDLSSLIRMSTPKYPIFGNIQVNVHSFFVPMRLVFDKTEEFFGENKTSAGPQTSDIKLPSMKYGVLSSGTLTSGSVATVGSISHYLGKPLAGGETLTGITFAGIDVNVLKERGYHLIWNEMYRAQQFQDPWLIYTGTESKIAQSPSTLMDTDWSQQCLTVNKKFDYFTSVTKSPQYSADPVELPLGDYAPLGFLMEETDNDVVSPYVPKAFVKAENQWINPYGNYVVFGRGGDDVNEGDKSMLGTTAIVPGDGSVAVGGLADAFQTAGYNALSPISDSDFYTNFVVNLSEAVAANVNTIRTAFALQRYLERDNFGTRYPEVIKAHFGVNSSLAILQRPQLLKKATFNINIQQVLTTAETTNGGVTRDVGQPGANSVTANRSDIVDNAFDEFGYLYILLETKHNRLYSQGLDAFDLKLSKFDFYFPEFASIGDQAIKVKQIFGQPGLTNEYENVFGYQEAWAEYRYFPDRVSGLLDPQAPSNLSFTNLADAVAANKVKSGVTGEWLKEDRDAIARCLVSGVSGPDYLADFAVNGTMIRTMPLYSIPGLVDHVGGM